MKKKLFVLMLAVTVVFSGCSSIIVDVETQSSTEETTAVNSEESIEEVPISPEPNSSAMVDQILLQAKEDAQSISDDEATAKWEEAFTYLKEHMNDFYESNEVMEQSMYYGEYIYQYIEANATATNVSELTDSTKAAYDAGYNVVKAIKYVYRGTASVDDEETQNALNEAIDNLSKFK